MTNKYDYAFEKDGIIYLNPMPSQVLQKRKLVEGTGPYEGELKTEQYDVENLRDANIISSRVDGSDKHKPVLDIDMPVKVIPSSTEGHFHLYIDKELTWNQYMHLMWVLTDVGILQEGYFKASLSRQESCLRLPWIKKETDG